MDVGNLSPGGVSRFKNFDYSYVAYVQPAYLHPEEKRLSSGVGTVTLRLPFTDSSFEPTPG